MRVSIIFILGGWTPYHFCTMWITQSWVSISDMPRDRHSCASTADSILLFSFPTGCRFRLQMHSWLLKRASADVSAVFLCFVCICPHPCANEILRGLIKHTELEPQLWQWRAYPAPVEDMTWETTEILIKKDGQRLGERERERSFSPIVAQGHFPFRSLKNKCPLPWDLMDVSFWTGTVGTMWEWTHDKAFHSKAHKRVMIISN